MRIRSERPFSSVYDIIFLNTSHHTHHTLHPCLSDIPTRHIGWFQRAFNFSAIVQIYPSATFINITLPPSGSPRGKSFALQNTVKAISTRQLMRYLLDSDSIPNKCADVFWLLDVPQPGYELPPVQAVSLTFLWSGSVDQGRHIPSASRHIRRLQLPLSALTRSYLPK